MLHRSSSLLAIGLILAAVGWAQRTTADIVGTATDATGAVLPGVKITVKNRDTGAEYAAVSDNAGNYLVTLLPIGHYSLRAEAAGFKAWSVPEVALAIAAPWYNTNYHSLQTTLERRFQNGFSMLAAYTWAHSIDDEPAIVNNPRTERGNSFLDLRHRFTLLANYDLPFAKSARGVAGALAKGWRVNAVTVLTTGLPFSISNAAARANTGAGDRPNLVGDSNLPADQRSIFRWFNTAVFAPQPLYTFGNVGRNTMHGPSRKSLDLSVHREFSPTERTTLQFRVEAFNVTNTPAFDAPGGALGSTGFGVISSAGLPRNMQLALKLLF